MGGSGEIFVCSTSTEKARLNEHKIYNEINTKEGKAAKITYLSFTELQEIKTPKFTQ